MHEIVGVNGFNTLHLTVKNQLAFKCDCSIRVIDCCIYYSDLNLQFNANYNFNWLNILD